MPKYQEVGEFSCEQSLVHGFPVIPGLNRSDSHMAFCFWTLFLIFSRELVKILPSKKNV